LHGEGAEVPAALGGGQADVVALLQAEVAVGGGDGAPLAGVDVAQGGLNGGGQLLHSGGDERVVLVGAVGHAVGADVVLVHVHADDVAVGLDGSLQSGGVDAAAAGKDDLGAAGVPALHTGGDRKSTRLNSSHVSI